MNPKLRNELGREGLRTAFAGWSNRLAGCKSLSLEFHPVHDDARIDVILRFAGPHV